ncbi:6494_t:CDS:2 [Dentiscutata heterogama]|uniref:6494_t:CDS:1 n=1 Tax=Dentiscutata heterogama TaxID=1316150 RepID=A0ACA9JZR9_9GLOM|nr:6494_t:CDS:2 [Dentiscutata heterogama]
MLFEDRKICEYHLKIQNRVWNLRPNQNAQCLQLVPVVHDPLKVNSQVETKFYQVRY